MAANPVAKEVRLPPVAKVYPMESVSTTVGLTSSYAMPKVSAACWAMEARVPPMSHRAHDKADRAIEVNGHYATGLEAAVHPEASGHAAALVLSAEGSLVMVVVLGRFQAFHETDAPGHRTFDAASTFGGGVQQPKSMGSKPNCSHISSITDSTPNAAWGEPGAR